MGSVIVFNSCILGNFIKPTNYNIAEQFSTNTITRLAIKLTKVKNLNFFENKDHTIKLNAIHNGLYIRPLNYVNNLFLNLQRYYRAY
ncbi:putative secretion/efflux ABC transporter,ATP-binding protein fragment 1 [Helicobacter acinonychis str. Sheeba]|uniref:Secretion/efflux ABC transporter,ATP-binding protein 1 n=1 Tax=Helicobacter acinonychis (strain Sheeba) TaxID=382638 RepID=Q17W41_HELAH|nr:putative secretion/efflux ABC transporter,ATP-binding protein fragment 1 [Helicobacter acinonychis str. Sheeba]